MTVKSPFCNYSAPCERAGAGKMKAGVSRSPPLWPRGNEYWAQLAPDNLKLTWNKLTSTIHPYTMCISSTLTLRRIPGYIKHTHVNTNATYYNVEMAKSR